MLFLPVRTFGDSVCACICAQSCPTLCNLIDCSPPVSFIYGIFQAKILEWVAISFSRRSFWLRDQIHISRCCCCWVASVGSDSVQPHRRQPTRLPCPWDPPGKNTGVDCHFLLPCMKVKSEREVIQLCPTLSDPMDCSPPGSFVHGISQARVLEWGAIAFSTISLRSPELAGGFFASWAIREVLSDRGPHVLQKDSHLKSGETAWRKPAWIIVMDEGKASQPPLWKTSQRVTKDKDQK